MNDNYPIVVKTYQLSLWYIKKIERFPKNHKFTLGEKIQNEMIELLMIYTQAVYSKNKRELLNKANLSIEKLRILTRLLNDLDVLSTQNRRFVLDSLNEIGAMSGGWSKSLH
ncbi:MAG: diversity-generating retroelement protein Avd [Campylobacterota bacterium]|nr:diversity-generating retroelement protein Avd [Campylobacterota bacterium]